MAQAIAARLSRIGEAIDLRRLDQDHTAVVEEISIDYLVRISP
jgi:hypothetical protein